MKYLLFLVLILAIASTEQEIKREDLPPPIDDLPPPPGPAGDFMGRDLYLHDRLVRPIDFSMPFREAMSRNRKSKYGPKINNDRYPALWTIMIPAVVEGEKEADQEYFDAFVKVAQESLEKQNEENKNAKGNKKQKDKRRHLSKYRNEKVNFHVTRTGPQSGGVQKVAEVLGITQFPATILFSTEKKAYYVVSEGLNEDKQLPQLHDLINKVDELKFTEIKDFDEVTKEISNLDGEERRKQMEKLHEGRDFPGAMGPDGKDMRLSREEMEKRRKEMREKHQKRMKREDL